MAGFHLALVVVGKVDPSEVEAVASRAAKLLRQPLELRGSLPVPQGAVDPDRGQYRATTVMRGVRAMVPQLGPGKMIGAEGDESDKPPLKTDGYVFITDVDLYTANTDGVHAALLASKGLAVVSIRRLREAFYRRKADLNKQRTRLVKETTRMAARLRGAPECRDVACVLAASKMLADLDIKEERFCRACSQRLFEGTVRI